jgi:hypothetical protein
VQTAPLLKPKQIDIYSCRYRELRLQELNGAALRKIAGKTDYITWFAKNSEDAQAILLQLSVSLRGWFKHTNPKVGSDPGLQDDPNVTASADIDKSLETLARHKLKIFGATYIGWSMMHQRPFDHPVRILEYRSGCRAALSIVPQSETNSTVQVSIGVEPPKKFVETELVGIDRVGIDGTQVWPRRTGRRRPAK